MSGVRKDVAGATGGAILEPQAEVAKAADASEQRLFARSKRGTKAMVVQTTTPAAKTCRVNLGFVMGGVKDNRGAAWSSC